MKKINISFFLNGDLIEKKLDPESRVLDLLRNILWKTGTKEGCGDGDCGACTITQAYPLNNKIIYKAVNSCLMPVGKLQGTSIITIEGLEENNDLNLIQQAMVDQHGLQCGFCSPGISMSMFALLANKEIPSYDDLKNALNGNICRCTGYEGIRDAAKQVLNYLNNNPNYDIVPKKIRECENKLIELELSLSEGDYLIPLSIETLKENIKNNPTAMIVCGCSDVSARAHISGEKFLKVIDVSRVKEMNQIQLINEDLCIGASVSLTEIINSPIVQEKAKVLSSGLKELAALQVRNLATLAGNIKNASPIADGVVLLMAYEAKLSILGISGYKEIPISELYIGYKKTILEEGDIIEKIIISKEALSKEYHMEKTGKRNSVDIACVNSCASYKKENNIISDLSIAFGGISEKVVLEKIGKIENEYEIEICARDISLKYNPLSDVRGSKDYRVKLIKNHVIKHYAFITGEL